MTVDEMVAVIKGRMLNNTDSSLDALIVNEANIVRLALETAEFIPWFLFVDTKIADTNLTTVASSEVVDVPSDFGREYADTQYCAYRYNSTGTDDDKWVPLVKRDYTLIKEQYLNEGTPLYYDLLNRQIYLRPVPDAAYGIRLLYWKKDYDLSSGGAANLWLTYAPDWLLNEVGMIMSSMYVNLPQVYQRFEQEAAKARKRIFVDTIARQESGQMRQMGDD